MSAGHPAWVATWGTRMALICAPDATAVRARVRERTVTWIDDDEISVRRATPADEDLVDQVDGGSPVALTDWKYGLTQ